MSVLNKLRQTEHFTNFTDSRPFVFIVAGSSESLAYKVVILAKRSDHGFEFR